ncbi:MAG: hypothetical protein ABI678_05045 [Kofleriaceae bacterium]
MTVTAIPGAIRERYNQLGIQTVLNTAVAATRKVPWRGIISYQPNVTDPDVDVGSLDPILLPYTMAVDVGWNPTGPLDFDNATIRLSAGLKGGVAAVGAGTAKTWTYQVASLTQDVFDVYTNQSADDTEATDTIIAYGGVIDVAEETSPEDGGPWTISDTWIFSGATLGANGTDGIVIDASPEWAFGTDTAYYMDTVAGSIGITPMDGVHNAVIRVTNNLDRKRFQNGSNTRNQLAGYSRGPRMIELILTVAKTAAWVTERATFDDTPRVNRFFKVSTQSIELAQAATPFRYDRLGAFRLFDATDTEVNNNAAIELTYRAYYDATLTYAYKAILVNTLATLP